MKRTQNLKILDLLRCDGFVTTRRIMMKASVNQPFARLAEIRRIIDLEELRVKKGKTYFKIWYLPGKKTLVRRYMQDNNLRGA